MRIQCDDRELEARVESVKRKRSLEVEVCRLEVGDYILGGRIAIEFKETKDFIGSLMDGRIWNQLDELHENYAEEAWLVIEVGKNGVEDSLSESSRYRYNAKLRAQHALMVQSAILSIIEKKRVNVLTVRDSNEFADWLIVMKHRLEKDGKSPIERAIKTRKSKNRSIKEESEDVVCAVSGVGRKQSRLILKDANTIKRLCDYTATDLEKIPGVGKKTAQHLLEVLNYSHADE